MNDLLKEIIDHKRQRVTQCMVDESLTEIRQRAQQVGEPARDFIGALLQRISANQTAVIAEIKKASPSAGLLRAEFDPAEIAQRYAENQAACLSVLTDDMYFQGDNRYLALVKHVCNLPVLRKDFMVDEWQIHESRCLGADAVLLIAAVLSSEQLVEYAQCAHELGMAALVEIHDEQELVKALNVPSPLIGINNRNLKTLAVDLNTTIRLAALLPTDMLVVCESGIKSRDDRQTMTEVGVRSFLIGESFMRAPCPGQALAEFLK